VVEEQIAEVYVVAFLAVGDVGDTAEVDKSFTGKYLLSKGS
jgi:hypothetical protein